jgi:xanthine/uracil permease
MARSLPTPYLSTDLVQAALLVCGISSAIQVTGFRFGPIRWGAGILSVMGVSFASVGIYQSCIGTMMAQGDSFGTAYGRMLGTTAFCAVIPVIFSFIPFKILKRVFPPVVTSATIMMIGINLTGSGFKVR